MKNITLLAIFSLLLMGMTTQSFYIPTKKLIKETEKTFQIETPEFEEIKVDSNVIHPFKGQLYSVNHQKKIIGYTYMGRVNSCRLNGCSDPSNNLFNNESTEYFHYFIILNMEGKILKVRIYDYQASRGHAIMAKSWLKQFNNYYGKENITYGKDVDAVSGATISATSLVNDINFILPIIKNNILSD